MDAFSNNVTGVKSIIVETPSQIPHYLPFIEGHVQDRKFYTIGNAGYIIPLLGFANNTVDPFNGKYNTIKSLLNASSEIVVATDYSLNGEKLFFLLRDLLELPKSFTRIDTRDLTKEALKKSWINRMPEGQYQVPK